MGHGVEGARTPPSGNRWRSYVADFHDDRPGITEDVLGHARHGADTPYSWLIEAVPAQGLVLDLACGSGPLQPQLTGRWIGADVSEAELRLAAERGAPLVRADGAALSVADGSVDAVVCSMALMLMDGLGAVLGEVGRVLRPGGRFAVLLPASRPLSLRDRYRYARLLLALGQRIRYPNDAPLASPQASFAAAGLDVMADDHRRFVCHLDEASVAVLCVRSLYLPGSDPARVAAAERVAARWTGSSLGLPLRRLVAARR